MTAKKLSDAELLEMALQSPALKEQHKSDDRAAYPANYRGRVPLKVKMAKDVRPDMPMFLPERRPDVVVRFNPSPQLFSFWFFGQ